ncbi:hypothetical protein HK099_003898 [Clydaea vesicula]|uniref:Uncharacterized protein n=1 Tax=Clydaea vesicula TaxID=447962 RepID=A0AAD5U1F4_9FUNG|nr:hypothetical protein HK099_003898 [Clydaea vesicula]
MDKNNSINNRRIRSRLYSYVIGHCIHGGSKYCINTSSLEYTLTRCTYASEIVASCSNTNEKYVLDNNRDVCLYYIYWRSILRAFGSITHDSSDFNIYLIDMWNFIHVDDIIISIRYLWQCSAYTGKLNIIMISYREKKTIPLHDEELNIIHESISNLDDYFKLIDNKVISDSVNLVIVGRSYNQLVNEDIYKTHEYDIMSKLYKLNGFIIAIPLLRDTARLNALCDSFGNNFDVMLGICSAMNLSLINKLRKLASVELFDDTVYHQDHESSHQKIITDSIANNIILISVRYLSSDNNTSLRRQLTEEVSKGWTAFPVPPEGLEATDIIITMLYSYSYTVNATSFPWHNATESTFQCLWRLIERISETSSDKDVIRRLLNGRSIAGYSSSRNININNSSTNEPTMSSIAPQLINDICEANDIHNNASKYPIIISKSRYADNYVDVICQTITNLRSPYSGNSIPNSQQSTPRRKRVIPKIITETTSPSSYHDSSIHQHNSNNEDNDNNTVSTDHDVTNTDISVNPTSVPSKAMSELREISRLIRIMMIRQNDIIHRLDNIENDISGIKARVFDDRFLPSITLENTSISHTNNSDVRIRQHSSHLSSPVNNNIINNPYPESIIDNMESIPISEPSIDSSLKLYSMLDNNTRSSNIAEYPNSSQIIQMGDKSMNMHSKSINQQQQQLQHDSDSHSINVRYNENAQVFSAIILGIITYIQERIEIARNGSYTKGFSECYNRFTRTISMVCKSTNPIIVIPRVLKDKELLSILRRKSKNDILRIDGHTLLSLRNTRLHTDIFRTLTEIFRLLKMMPEILPPPASEIILGISDNLVSDNGTILIDFNNIMIRNATADETAYQSLPLDCIKYYVPLRLSNVMPINAKSRSIELYKEDKARKASAAGNITMKKTALMAGLAELKDKEIIIFDL